MYLLSDKAKAKYQSGLGKGILFSDSGNQSGSDLVPIVVEVEQTKLLPQCQPNEVLQEGGPGDYDYVCVCKEGTERVDGYCLPECKHNEVRDSNRNCVPDDKGKGTGKGKGKGK